MALIQSVKDLRTITFENLFYSIYDAGDRQEVVDCLLDTLAPNLDDSAKTKGELTKLRMALSQIQDAEERFQKAVNPPRPDYSKMTRQKAEKAIMDDFISRQYPSPVGKALEFKRNAEINMAYMEDVLGALNPVNDFLPSDLKKFEHGSASLVIEKLIEEREALPRAENWQTALSKLPTLETDEDLILFFGHEFKKTFSEVNAYIGLVYAADFFER